jgi:hypothetical protein
VTSFVSRQKCISDEGRRLATRSHRFEMADTNSEAYGVDCPGGGGGRRPPQAGWAIPETAIRLFQGLPARRA